MKAQFVYEHAVDRQFIATRGIPWLHMEFKMVSVRLKEALNEAGIGGVPLFFHDHGDAVSVTRTWCSDYLEMTPQQVAAVQDKVREINLRTRRSTYN